MVKVGSGDSSTMLLLLLSLPRLLPLLLPVSSTAPSPAPPPRCCNEDSEDGLLAPTGTATELIVPGCPAAPACQAIIAAGLTKARGVACDDTLLAVVAEAAVPAAQLRPTQPTSAPVTAQCLQGTKRVRPGDASVGHDTAPNGASAACSPASAPSKPLVAAPSSASTSTTLITSSLFDAASDEASASSRRAATACEVFKMPRGLGGSACIACAVD